MFSLRRCDALCYFQVNSILGEHYSLYSHLFCRGLMLYWCYLCLFTYTGVQHDFHITRCSYRLTVTRGVTSVAGTAYPSGVLTFTAVISVVHVAQSLVFCVVFCKLLFVRFLLAIVLSSLRITASDYQFKHFLVQLNHGCIRVCLKQVVYWYVCSAGVRLGTHSFHL
jgi:hypothetical protein